MTEHKNWKMFRGNDAVRKLHQHECDICGFLWKHCERQVALMDPEAKRRAHSCPNCGHAQREKGDAGLLSPEAKHSGSPDLNKLIELGRLCLQLGRVNRATYHEDGVRPESDTDHTVMLGVVACAFSAQYAPHLDRGLIAQFSLVHDFVEAHAGDTVTLGLDGDGLVAKTKREAAALAKLTADFSESLPWLPMQIAAYESQSTSEARFVKVIDKVLPALTHLLNGGMALKERSISQEQRQAMHDSQRSRIAASYGADQPEALDLLRTIHAMLDEQGKAHYHKCPECYVSVRCLMNCSIVGDLFDGGKRHGSHATCSECEEALHMDGQTMKVGI